MKRLAFILITVAAVLLTMELAARLLPSGEAGAAGGAALRFDRNPEMQEGNARYWAPDGRLFWRMRPDLAVDFGGMALATNAGGFRDRAHVRRPGTRLVAVLGDSTVFGWGVPETADRFPDRLEGLLAAAGHPVEVYNFGQSGYATVQGRRLLQSEVLPLAPDVVVLLFGANDYGPASSRIDADQPVADVGGGVALAQGWLRRSALYRRLTAALVRARDASGGAAAATESDGVLRRVPAEGFAAGLEAMIQDIRRAGAVPVLLTYPRRPIHPILPCPLPAQDDPAALAEWDARLRQLGEPLQEAVEAARAAPAFPMGQALAAWDRLSPEIRRGASGLYGEAWILQRAGDSAGADTALQAAAAAATAGDCALDLFATRLFRYREEPAARRYNDIIRQVAAVDGVALVDAAALLRGAQQELARDWLQGREPPTRVLGRWFGAESFFVDAVHPSARGHALLAEALAEPVASALGL